MKSDKENLFSGGGGPGVLTPHRVGAVVKNGGAGRRMTVGESGTRVGAVRDAGRMSAVMGSGGGMRGRESGRGVWR